VATLPEGRGAAAAGPTDEPKRPWGQRLADPSLWLAVAAATSSYGLMVMLMAASPVAMHEHGHPLSASTLVLQAHVLGMYIPSFFTGWLVTKWGPRKMIAAGLVVFVAELVQALQGTTFFPFFASLTLLGIGWNFLYVGGTNLLVTRYRPSEKAGTQALNDSFVYLFATVSTFGAGAFERGLGWDGLQWVSVPFLVLVAVLLVVSRQRNAAPG
jgi:MFS family permease